MIKNAFYFTALSLLKMLNFCPDFLDHAGEHLNKKAKVNFKTYYVISVEKNNSMHILPYISRNKGNKTMKFDRLVEYDAGRIFPKKTCTK